MQKALDEWLILWDKICGKLEDVIHHLNVLSLEMRRLKPQLDKVKWQQDKLKGQLEWALLVFRAKASRTGNDADWPSKTEKCTLKTEVTFSRNFKPQVGNIIRMPNTNTNQENKKTVVSFLEKG